MTIVSTDYRPKRPQKRKKSPAIPAAIVSPAPMKKRKLGPEVRIAEEKPAPAAVTSVPRIVMAKKPRPKHGIGPEQIAAARDAAPADPPQAARKTAIVTAPRKTSTRFGPVQDTDAEEHQRRGDAAVELFRELVRRATWNAGT